MVCKTSPVRFPRWPKGWASSSFEDRDPPALIWSIARNVGNATQFMRFVPTYVTRMLQAHRGAQWCPKQILTTLPPPLRAKTYASQLGCPLVFNSQINAIEITARPLCRQTRNRPACLCTARHLCGLFAGEVAPLGKHTRRCCNCNSRWVDAGPARFRFRRTAAGPLLADAAAQDRCVGYFTLIRDEIRFELAASMIAHSDLSIGEIAYRLGYSETASFTHGFSKRFGKSPRWVWLLSMLAT